MKDLLDKLSSYNIFNYLLPGILFVVLAKAFTSFSFVQQDLILGVFLYYFIGLVISRIGSLVIEPLLKLCSFIQFREYRDFVTASSADPKIELLSEVNNTYRTMSSLFLLLLLIMGYDRLSAVLPVADEWRDVILLVALLALFLFSYRKQTSYITKRIDAAAKGRIVT